MCVSSIQREERELEKEKLIEKEKTNTTVFVFHVRSW
jgi:hypothetical protein